MRSVSLRVRRSTAVLSIIAVLLVPIAGVADDSQIRPPQPQSIVQPSVWHILLSRILPFIS